MDLNEKINFDDFKSICRFCLKQDFILKPIFINETTANDADSIVHMISSCIGLQINATDGLPEFLCTQCLTNLTALNIFKNQCVSSEIYLKTIKLNYEQNCDSNMSSLAITTLSTENNRTMRPKRKTQTKIITTSGSLSSRSSSITSISPSINNDPNYNNDYIKMEIFDIRLPEQYLQENTTEDNNLKMKIKPVEPLEKIAIINNTDEEEMQPELKTKIKRPRKKKLPLLMNDDNQQINIHNNDVQQTAPIPKPKRKRIRTKKYKHKPRPPEICPICGKMQAALRQHLTTHSSEKRYKCEFCDKRFKQRETLKDHLNVHTGARPYKCPVCDKAFGKASILRVHKRTHTDERRFPCQLCTKTFRHGYNLTQHLRSHSEDRRFKCDQCAKMFLTKAVLHKHYLTHTGERAFKCDICLKAYQTKWHLTVHSRIHTRAVKPKINATDGLPEFLCTQCLTNLTALNIFKNQCVSSELYLKTIKLNYEQNCDSNMSSLAITTLSAENNRTMRPKRKTQTEISTTFVSLRSRSSSITCSSPSINNDPNYNNEYIKMEIFDSHLPEQYLQENTAEDNNMKMEIEPDETLEKIVTINNTVEVFNIAIDDKIQPDLRPKIKRQRKKKLPLIMNDDDQQINIPIKNEQQTVSLPKPKRKRIRTKKYKNKPRLPVICPVCGVMQTSLTQHMISHSVEKRYECEFCDKRFKQRDSLKDHLNVHTGAKPYKCLLCDKAFGKASILRVHKRTHTDERRFPCHLCTKTFRYGNNLTQHLRGHSEDRRFKCDQCAKMFLTKAVLHKHYLTHTGERAFKCDICLKAYQTKWHLTVHSRIHTRAVKPK